MVNVYRRLCVDTCVVSLKKIKIVRKKIHKKKSIHAIKSIFMNYITG